MNEWMNGDEAILNLTQHGKPPLAAALSRCIHHEASIVLFLLSTATAFESLRQMLELLFPIAAALAHRRRTLLLSATDCLWRREGPGTGRSRPRRSKCRTTSRRESLLSFSALLLILFHSMYCAVLCCVLLCYGVLPSFWSDSLEPRVAMFVCMSAWFALHVCSVLPWHIMVSLPVCCLELPRYVDMLFCALRIVGECGSCGHSILLACRWWCGVQCLSFCIGNDAMPDDDILCRGSPDRF